MFVPQEKWRIETKGEREPSVLPPAASQPWHDVEKKSLTRHGATLGGRLDTSVKKDPPPQKKEKPFPQMHLEHLPKSPPASSIHLPCSPRVNPDVSLTGRIRARERVHSVVTCTRCAPLTQNTQPVDMPHRHHTDPPHNQRHTCFHSHSGLGALYTAVSTHHMSLSLSFSVFCPPPFLLIFSSCQTHLQSVYSWG